MAPLRITVWNEFVHEREQEAVGKIYPSGIHGAIGDALRARLGNLAEVQLATLQDAGQGLPAEVLEATDVLFWWGHAAHEQVEDELVNRVVARVWSGMGLVVLHSGHDSKPFKALMGTPCQLRWREAAEPEQVWIVDPGHPLVDGLDTESFTLPETEMYGEPFGVPAPDELVAISSFAGGEVFRSLGAWRRGRGQVVYFRPGHETYPIYFDSRVQQILANAARFAAPRGVPYVTECRHTPRA